MIRKALVLALVAVACAAWFASSELPELGKGDTGAATVGAAGYPSGRAGVSAARPRTFATLPDRGSLVSYPTPSPARVDGAYTWHRAELSEEHAFRSLQTGSLRITSPSGHPLEFEYSRHVEHPSGDWTWIGRLKGGKEADEAVITFGERAAFGAIAEPGKPNLRLTTSAGVAWLVETDPRKIATIESEATRPTRPDYLIPPEQEVSPSASQPIPMAAASAPTSSAAVAAAATTVDVVVGYTTGFAAALGGQSQAVTRLNNMVEIANQAYVNSQVDAAIRMVHSQQVDYPDNTANRTTLESLTGYRSGSGQIPVDPAFAALRAARDQYGGDLVTLVRKFQTPENDGCGIAWLIGGGRTGLDSGDAPFGYSVVSDGVDAGTDGKSYFCRPETLAHELGHNMGSQHDRATATESGTLSYGVFTYSFGYKTGATNGNFFTVMAYGDTGQVPYRVFSNPRITFCGGVACGVSEEADNARSLTATLPIVATFRAANAPPPSPQLVPGDLGNDGRSDLVWTNGGLTSLAIWSVNGTRVTQTVGYATGGDYQHVATWDLSPDGLNDLLLRGAAGDYRLWVNYGTGFNSLAFPSPSPAWSLVSVGNIDGINAPGVLWFNQQANTLAFWKMAGATITESSGVGLSPSEIPLVGGDFDGDNRLDVLLSSGASMSILTGTGSGFRRTAFFSYPQGWRVIGSRDFNGDGTYDVLWRSSTGDVAIWHMNGPSVVSSQGYRLSLDYQVVGLGDYDGNGRSDILLRPLSGAMHMWLIQPNNVILGWDFESYPNGWRSSTL